MFIQRKKERQHLGLPRVLFADYRNEQMLETARETGKNVRHAQRLPEATRSIESASLLSAIAKNAEKLTLPELQKNLLSLINELA